jgi:hypothetical protein
MWGTNRIVFGWRLSPCHVTYHGARAVAESGRRANLPLLLSNMMRKFHADEANSNSWSTTIERSLSLYYDMRHRRVEEIAAVGRALDKRMLKTQPLAEYIRYTLFRAINSFPYISE